MLDELPPFDYVDAASLAEAMAALAEHGPRAQVLAGGTDLLGLMKDRIGGPGMPVPEVLVNVKRIPELHGIAETADGGLRIGAAVTLADLERDARRHRALPRPGPGRGRGGHHPDPRHGHGGRQSLPAPVVLVLPPPPVPVPQAGRHAVLRAAGQQPHLLRRAGPRRVRDVAPLRPGAGPRSRWTRGLSSRVHPDCAQSRSSSSSAAPAAAPRPCWSRARSWSRWRCRRPRRARGASS